MPSLLSIGSTALAIAATSALATAQSFNIDLADTRGVPNANYAGAASQAGHWNAAPDHSVPVPLFDLSGAPTSVVMHQPPISWVNTGDDPNTVGQDEALYDDGFDISCCASFHDWRFEGLAAGTYEVTTYSFNPSHTMHSQFEVDGTVVQVDGPELFPGHVHGQTFARHLVTLDGVSDLVVRAYWSLFWEEINGFQLKHIGVDSTPYCDSLPNSSGLPGLMHVSGTLDDLNLTATNVPDAIGLFYYGSAAAQVPFGNGVRCVGGTLTRLYPFVVAQEFSVGLQDVDLSQTGLSTIYLQYWFRDPAAGGSFFGLSGGLSIP